MALLQRQIPTLQQIRQEKARRHLEDFLTYDGRGNWQTAPHLHMVCHALEAVEARKLFRLMVFMPPRHGKSEVVSKKYPAWVMGRNPDDEFILASYAAELAHDFSRIARNTFDERGPELWGLEISKDSKSVDRWGIGGHRGGMAAVGVGGPITGRGGRVIVVDDPIKNAEEAQSPVIRQRVFDWYQSTLYTRQTPDGAIILVMTRWHEDDLAGHILREEPHKWEVISLPALAEEGDKLGREAGEPLWAVRGFDKEWAESTKASVGTQVWSALYQQHPSPQEGGILKRAWWRFYSKAPERFDEVLQSWDLTFKDLDTSDYVVGQVWGRVGADKYLLDQIRAKMDFPTTINAIKMLSSKWPQARTKLIEDKANGPAVIATLKHKVSGLIPVEPLGSKVARVQAASPDVEAGNVYLPDPLTTPWVKDFVEECAAFPNGLHDDMCDCLAYAIDRFNMRRQAHVVRRPRGC